MVCPKPWNPFSGWKMLKKLKFSPASILLVLALIALAIPCWSSVSTYTTLAHAALTFRYPVDYGEGPLLDQVLRLASGENIYHNNFSNPPYTISNYPPVFLLVQVPFALAFGPAFWYGRLISILGALLTAVLVGLTLQKLTRDWISAVAAGLIFLAFPYVQLWSIFNRIDLLALVLSWAGLFVVVWFSGRRWGIPAAAALLILSIYTRQTYALAAPFGAFVWLLVERQWRKAIQLALITGGVTLVLFLALNLVTQGGFFLNIVSANVNPFYWNTVKNYLNGLTDHAWILLILIGVFLVGERFRGHTRSWPLALPYLIAAAASAVTVGKDGSSVNYLLELAAALGFAGGAALAWLGKNTWLKAVVVLALFFQVGMLNDWMQRDYYNDLMDRVKNEAEVAALFQAVKDADGIVLADEFMGLVPLAGKRLYFQPFEYKMLAQAGIWDESGFLKDIEAHKYALILWYDPSRWPAVKARWTPRQREMIQTYYRQNGSHCDTRLLTPR
jgi:hypothetical protein